MQKILISRIFSSSAVQISMILLISASVPGFGLDSNENMILCREKAELAEVFINDLFVNELYPDPSLDIDSNGEVNQEDEFIELFNQGVNPVNLSGFSLNDGEDTFIIGDITIESGGYVIFIRSSTSIVLGRDEEVVLSDPNSTVVNTMEFTSASKGDSFQRSPDGSNRIRRTNRPTPCGENIPPPKLLINEIMIDPFGANTGNQWIEIYNRGGEENLKGFRLFNGDGFDATMGEYELGSGRRIILSTGDYGIDDPHPPQVENTALGEDSPLYVNGDNLELIDPDGYSLDYLAWGSSSHVDPPSGIEGEIWKGQTWDDMNSTMKGFLKNPSVTEGRSLIRYPDGNDTDSPRDWTTSSVNTMGSPGWDNSIDPGLEIIPPDNEIYLNRSEKVRINFLITNSGNMSGDVEVIKGDHPDGWEVNLVGEGKFWMKPGSSRSIDLDIMSPPDFEYIHRFDLNLYARWMGMNFINWSERIPIILPGPDLSILEAEISGDITEDGSAPEGGFLIVNGKISGGGELECEEALLRLSVKGREEENLLIMERQFQDILTTSRRSFQFEVDTLGFHGNYSLNLSIDPENMVDEIDERNNYWSYGITVIPSVMKEGAGNLVFTRLVWNTSFDGMFVVVGNPDSIGVDISGFKISDGIEFASFPQGSRLDPGCEVAIIWGEEADDRIGNVTKKYRIDSGPSHSRLEPHGTVPDPFSRGEIHLMDEHRKPIDSIQLRRDKKEVIGFEIIEDHMIETTWSSEMFRRGSYLGNPLDTNTSSDWDYYSTEAYISTLLIRPRGSPGEFVILKSDNPGADLSGYTLSCGNRICTIPNGTRADSGGDLIISRDVEAFLEVNGEYPDLTTSYGISSGGGEYIEGCRVPSFGELLLPDSGRTLRLMDPGSREIDNVSWGDDSKLGYPDSNTMIGRGSPDGRWMVLGSGDQVISGCTVDRFTMDANLSLFRYPSSALEWVSNGNDLDIHTEGIISMDYLRSLHRLIDGKVDMKITFLKEPWEELEEWKGGEEKRTFQIQAARSLLEKGADIYHMESEEIPVFTLSRSGNRISISTPMPCSGNGTKTLNLGIEIKDPKDNMDWWNSLLPDHGSIRESGSVLENLDVGSIRIGTDETEGCSADFLWGPAQVKIGMNTGLRVPRIPGSGPITFYYEGGPLDLLSIRQEAEKGTELNLAISPRSIKPYRSGGNSFIDKIVERMENGSHLLKMEQLESDILARSVISVGSGESVDQLNIRMAPSGPFSGTGFNYFFRQGGMSFGPAYVGELVNPIVISVDLLGQGITIPWKELWNSTLELPSAMVGFSDDDGIDISPTVRIEEIYYDTYIRGDDDEYVALYNYGDEEVDISGYTISDDEGSGLYMDGTLMIGGGEILCPGERYYMTLDGGLFRHQNGFRPDACLYNDSTASKTYLCSGFLRLANSNDTVCLRDGFGRVIDVIPYGSAYWESDNWLATESGEWSGDSIPDVGWGRILKRTPTRCGSVAYDTNTRKDWLSYRPYYPGQSSHRLSNWTHVESGQIGICPQSSSALLGRIIETARGELLVNVYELTSNWITSKLIGARQRGVKVLLLVEGAPVGGRSISEENCLNRLLRAGVEVRTMENIPTGDIRDRYRFDHAKYVIRDSQELLVSSDNFKDTSFPPEGEYPFSGTRGWIVRLNSAGISEEMRTVFLCDWNGMDSIPWVIDDDPYEMVGLTLTSEGVGSPYEALSNKTFSEEVMAIPLLCPDHISLPGNPLLNAIDEAKEEILVEQLDIDLDFTVRGYNTTHCPRDRGNDIGFPGIEVVNPYVSSLFQAAKRGVEVSVLLDGSDFDGDGTRDNEEVAALINDVSRSLGLDHLLTARVHPITRSEYMGETTLMHNKGMIIDSRYCWISSFNWGPTSALENREIGVLLDSKEASSGFRQAFMYDWGATLKDDLYLEPYGGVIKDHGEGLTSLKMDVGFRTYDEYTMFIWIAPEERVFEIDWGGIPKGLETVKELNGEGHMSINWSGHTSSERFAVLVSDGERVHVVDWIIPGEYTGGEEMDWSYPWYKEPFIPVAIILVGAISISLLIHGGVRRGGFPYSSKAKGFEE